MQFILRKYGILMLVLTHWASQAQHNSQLGRFFVDFPRGCISDTVFVTPANDKANTYYYETGLIDVLDTFHIYNSSGIYNIVQLAQEDLVPKTDSLLFEVMPNDDPQFEIYECGARTVQIEITDNIYDFYRIHFTSSVFVDYIPGNPFPSYTYPSNNVQVLVEGHYNNAYPNCGSTFKSIVLNNSIVAAIITSASLIQTCGTLFDVTINSTVLPNVKYQVEIAFNGGGYSTIYEGPLTNSFTIRDVTNPGFLDFCIRINTVEPCSNTITNGPVFCGTIPASQFEYLSNAYASYSGNRVALVFNNQSFQDVLTQNISTGSTIDTISSPITYPAAGNNTYRMVMIDSCETILDSAVVMPPFLSITDRNYEINEISLELEDPINELTETSRELVFYSEDSSVVEVLNFDQQIRLSANIGSIQHIRARYWYAEISEPVYSNEVSTRFIYRIYVPTAFTPNNDGLNDRLEFFGLENNSAEVSIFNRWGQQIHFTDNLSLGWNGFVNDEPAPEGSYTYEIKFTSPDGEELVQVGTFALIKK